MRAPASKRSKNLLAKRSVKMTGYRTAEVKKQLVHNLDDRTEFQIEPGTVDPREVIRILDEGMPADVNLFTGSGSTAGFSNILFRRQRPVVLASHFFGCIGQMLPAAMGGVTALGNKPSFLVDGDASIMMHLAEFETMVRYKMPLLVVCMNNESLGAEYYKLDAHKMNAALANIAVPDLGKVAVAMGGRGRIARSLDDVQSAMKSGSRTPAR